MDGRDGGRRSSTEARSGRPGYTRDAPRHNRVERGDREERTDAQRARAALPPVPDGTDPQLLDPAVRADLRSLAPDTAASVTLQLVAAGLLIDDDPQQALVHARAARSVASRIAAVREAVGVAAYHAQEWAEALAELRAARRISGDPRWLPVMADCERALGRPERALKTIDDPDFARLDAATQREVYIVVAGARRDLGQDEAALQVLARGGVDPGRPSAGSSRVWYAYADTLLALGRRSEAAQWFSRVANLDEDETDAADRAAALD